MTLHLTINDARADLPDPDDLRLLLDESAAAEHAQHAADEQKQACQHYGPTALQPRPALSKPRLSALAGEENDDDDREQRQDERDVVEDEEPDLLRELRSGRTDTVDHGKVWRGGRKLDRCDRRARDQRGATASAAAG